MVKMMLPVDIDDELAPLVKEMNKIGLITKFCCSGHSGGNKEAYIAIDMDCIVDVVVGRKDRSTGERQLTITWKRKK